MCNLCISGLEFPVAKDGNAFFARVYKDKKTQTGLIGSYHQIDSAKECAAMCTSPTTYTMKNAHCWTFQYDDRKKTCGLIAAWITGNVKDELKLNVIMTPYPNSSIYSSKEAKWYYLVHLCDLYYPIHNIGEF